MILKSEALISRLFISVAGSASTRASSTISSGPGRSSRDVLQLLTVNEGMKYDKLDVAQ